VNRRVPVANRRTARAFLALAAAGVPASGQSTIDAPVDTLVFRVPEIIVEAPRPATTVGGASAVEVTIDSLAFPVAASLEETLRELPMLHVRTNSRGEAELSARGSESRQVAVLVDGVPMTLAWDARADVSVIPATALQDLVFVRGLASMLYGPNVLGGVIETNVGRALFQPEARSIRVTLGADNVGSHGTTVTTSLPFENSAGEWLVRGGVGYRNTPGQPLARGISEPLDAGDNLRLNTDAASIDGFGALRLRSKGGAWLSLSGSSFRAERGIAAELGVDDARFWRYPHVSRTLAVVSTGTGDRASPVGGRGDLEASIGIDRGRTDIDSYTSRTYDEIDGFEDGRDRTVTLRFLGDQSLGRRGDLRGAFTLADIRHDEIIPDGKFHYRQRLWSVGAENIWRLVGGVSGLYSLRLTAGGAYDVGETPEAGGREPLGRRSEWGARVGVTAGLGGGDALVHAGVSRRARFPALRELYSGALNRFAPNPNLRPENLVAMEAGVTARVGNGEGQLVAFHNRLRDAVVRITLDDRRFMRVNRNELTSVGLELMASQVFGPFSLAGDLTLQDVDLTDTQARETHRPENLPEVFGALGAGFPLVLGFRGHADARYTGRQFCIDPVSGEDARLDEGVILGAALFRAWTWRGAFGGVETRLSVDNAGDVALYDQFGLPQAGRRLRFEVRTL
jgi:iron complex outermembrane receptor protein